MARKFKQLRYKEIFSDISCCHLIYCTCSSHVAFLANSYNTSRLWLRCAHPCFYVSLTDISNFEYRYTRRGSVRCLPFVKSSSLDADRYRGRILGCNWDKNLKSFPHCYLQSPLLRNFIPPPLKHVHEFGFRMTPLPKPSSATPTRLSTTTPL